MEYLKAKSFFLASTVFSAAVAQTPQEGIRARVSGSQFPGAICLKDLKNPNFPYSGMPSSGTGDFFFHYKSGQAYSVAIACQPKREQCSITSGGSGNAIPGTTQVNISCAPSVKQSVQPAGTKYSYAWALSSDYNQHGFPLFDNLDPNNLGALYLPPSTVPLAATSHSLWKGTGAQPASGLHDYSLIYRTEAAINRYTNGESHASYFNNWAFIRKMISFGGATDDGSHVIAPLPDWVGAAHRNGVKIYGSVFIGNSSAYQGLTDKLIGASNCTQHRDGTESCLFNTAAIDKLTKLAKTLNIDGWFLNVESGLEGDGIQRRARVLQINRLIRHKFPTTGIDYVVYSNTPYDLRGIISDGDIINFGEYPPSDQGLDNAAGISDSFLSGKINGSSRRNYLLYLDEPFTRNTPQDEMMQTYRLPASQQTQCQYFNGIGSWPGLKQYALAKFPSGVATDKLICGGNVSAPVPTRILKISISNGVTVKLHSGILGAADIVCTNDNPNSTLWGKQCYFELPSKDDISPTLTFSGKNFQMRSTIPDPKRGNSWWDGLPMSPLVGAKWWWISPDSHDQFGQFGFVEKGLDYWACKAASAQSTSCTLTFPSASSSFNVDTGAYGRPPYLNFMIDARFPKFLYSTP